MASTTSLSIEPLIQKINEDGVFSQKDAAKGSKAEEFAREKFPITTVDELEFGKAHMFGDPVSRPRPLSFRPTNIVNR